MIKINRNSLHLKEIETVNTMITTYNHEINNPLAIAYACLSKDFSQLSKDDIDVTFDAVKRISEIVKKIDEISDLSNINRKYYVSDVEMIDLD